MQGKGLPLRMGLMALVVVLIFGTLGSLSLAGDAFDDDYDDCPAVTRLDAVSGLAIDRTDENDEIRISWDQLDTAALSGLGTNAYRARLTVMVEGGGDHDAMNLALGESSLVVDGVSFTEALTVSVAVTQGDFVISDIAEADFISGMPAPSFSTNVRLTEEVTVDTVVSIVTAVDPDEDDGLKDLGSFYYLGFNDLFDNWYLAASAAAVPDSPSTPKFRVGVAHGDTDLDLGEAKFENYRITIEDSSGDLLGYQAETVAAAGTYGTNKIVFGVNEADVGTTEFTNIRLSNQVGADGAVSSYYSIPIGTNPGDGGLSYGNVGKYDADAATPVLILTDVVFAEAPAEYFDFPRDVFEDDGSYIISAWAEDDEGTRISPQASITISVQEQQAIADGRYTGYDAAGLRTWSATAVTGTNLTVFGFSIQDE